METRTAGPPFIPGSAGTASRRDGPDPTRNLVVFVAFPASLLLTLLALFTLFIFLEFLMFFAL